MGPDAKKTRNVHRVLLVGGLLLVPGVVAFAGYVFMNPSFGRDDQGRAVSDQLVGETREYACPNCGVTDSIPIGYGKPAEELIQQADRGEVILGGCVPHQEDRHCRACGHEWQTPDHPLSGSLPQMPSRRE